MVCLRKAEETDIDLIYTWANDLTVRSNSFHTHMIPYEEHMEWFARVMASDSADLYILVVDEKPVGQIRLDIVGDEAEISYSIAPDARGRGYGKTILEKIYDKVKCEYPGINRLKARVKQSNAISKRVFESEGYAMKYVCYERSVSRGGKLKTDLDCQYQVMAA